MAFREKYLMLTPVERSILEVLFKTQQPLSVGEIRNTFILARYTSIVNLAIKHRLIHIKPRTYFSHLYKTPSVISIADIRRMLHEFQVLKDDVPAYEKARILNKIFSKYNIKTIGNSTIENNLENLVHHGFIIRRKLRKAKANSLFVLATETNKMLSNLEQ